MRTDRLLVCAGNAQADFLGAGLARALSNLGEISTGGIGGGHMKAQGVDCWFAPQDIERQNLSQRIRNVVQSHAVRYWFRKYALRWDSPVFVGIDSPEFNFPMAQWLRKKERKTIHIVCPPIWGWTPKLFHQMRRSVDDMICLLPFEPEFFQGSGVRAAFVGHPLSQVITPSGKNNTKQEFLGLGNSSRPVVSILVKTTVGSQRKALPRLLDAAMSLQSEISVIVGVDQALTKRQIARIPNFGKALDSGVRVLSEGDIPSAQGEPLFHTLIQASDALCVCDPSTSLEVALYEKPMVFVSTLSPLSLKYFKSRSPIGFLSIPNMLLNEPLVTEINGAQPAAISLEIRSFLNASRKTSDMSQRLSEVRLRLAGDFYGKSAQIIADRLRP